VVGEGLDPAALQPDRAAHPEDPLHGLADALDAADDLPLDERLALLRRTEETIARALEGLDGL
jgi:hypothetical protein